MPGTIETEVWRLLQYCPPGDVESRKSPFISAAQEEEEEHKASSAFTSASKACVQGYNHSQHRRVSGSLAGNTEAVM
ncbi:hypothetical protein SKAU_G00242160 [Synaphobranchus kaupii]|uniref:Uncharacterized protein n=1 Tax=Synaphobranchus kaupii TaxID=118154 RepID=A0A9Q1F802_SYNKA|nr:hypothetical protein SKAU_G00242160 [Synaphobranchus kaupii]